MPERQAETLAETPAYLVRRFPHRGRDDTLVCTFAWSSRRSDGPDYLGRVAQREGFALIETLGRRSHHFDGLTPDALARLIAPHAGRARRLVTLGASLGGYLAILMAGRLGCESLAIAPRITLAPGREGSTEAHERARAAAARAGLDTQPVSPVAPTVVFDPAQRIDADFAWGLLRERYPALRVIAVPGAGHRVDRALGGFGVLAPLVRGLLRGEAPEAALANALARRRSGSTELHRAPMLIISGVERRRKAAEA